ncbi:MAG: hypothetical protein ABIL01_35710 [Pseudomonadota bacterium]
MRLSEYLPWLAATFVSLIFVSAILPAKWPEKAKVAFRLFVALLFFFGIGFYWLATGEKFDETVYRIVLCRFHSFERCSSAALIEKAQKEQQVAITVPPSPSSKVLNGGNVRTNGVYRDTVRENQRTYYEFVRFYADGTVIAANTPSAGVSENWFRKESPLRFPIGRYKIDGNKISFSTTSANGVVDYEGSLENEMLSLKFHSQINGGSFSGQYSFIPF